MPQLNINRVKPAETSSESLMQRVEGLFDRIQKRAYELFVERGSSTGNDFDDWLKAERELVFAPPAQLKETKEGFEIELAAPGFAATDLNVTATPESIVIEGKAEKRSEGKEGTLHFSEFNRQDLFRRLPMPSAVDTEHVYASLDNGILKITAKKAGTGAKPAASETKVETTAAGKAVAAS